MPATIGLIRNVGLDDAATADRTSHVGEPSVAAADGRMFLTGNWYASRSTDDGGSWTHVDPFTTLPSAVGGFCCDQLTLHDHRRGIWIWILQYIEQNGANVFRLAAARDADFAAGGGWYWWDIAPTTVDGSWTGLWFDYPDAALTSDSLGVTFNVFNAADQWQRAVVMRFPLDTIASGGSLGFNWWSTTDNGSLRLAQGGGPTLWWASHNSTRQLRLFSWPDGQGTVSWWDIGVSEWSTNIASTAPNGVDWLGRCDPRITGGWVAGGSVGFLWTAGASGNRPHAHVRAVTIDAGTKQVTAEPDLWSQSRAWAYPAAAPNGVGTVGVTAFYGGADRHPGHIVGARDGNAWVTAYSRLGSHSPDRAAWGDYLNCHDHTARDTWIASGYTLEGGQTRSDVVPRVVHFRLDQR